MPVLAVGVRLQPVAAHVEPDGRVEGHLLGEQHGGELVVEDAGVGFAGEVAAVETPVANGLGDAAYELADAGFALRGAELPVQILRGHDIGGGHRPVEGDFDIALLEDGVALGVGDGGGAALPLDFVVGRNAPPWRSGGKS